MYYVWYDVCMEKTVKYLRGKRNRDFSCGMIARLRLLPWATNQRTIVKMIMLDRTSGNSLRSRIEGSGKSTRYIISGADLLRYVLKYGPLLMQTKRNYGNNKRKY